MLQKAEVSESLIVVVTTCSKVVVVAMIDVVVYYSWFDRTSDVLRTKI